MGNTNSKPDQSLKAKYMPENCPPCPLFLCLVVNKASFSKVTKFNTEKYVWKADIKVLVSRTKLSVLFHFKTTLKKEEEGMLFAGQQLFTNHPKLLFPSELLRREEEKVVCYQYILTLHRLSWSLHTSLDWNFLLPASRIFIVNEHWSEILLDFLLLQKSLFQK